MFDSRIQGGLLADGINGLLASLATITPMSTYAQNNVRIAVSPSLFHVCDVLANEASGSHRSHSVRKPQCWVCMLVRNPIRNLPFSFFLSTQHSWIIITHACYSFFLIIMGIFSKFAASLVAIPSAVLGGMTTFLVSHFSSQRQPKKKAKERPLWFAHSSVQLPYQVWGLRRQCRSHVAVSFSSFSLPYSPLSLLARPLN